jgi:hypothetical protein
MAGKLPNSIGYLVTPPGKRQGDVHLAFPTDNLSPRNYPLADLEDGEQRQGNNGHPGRDPHHPCYYLPQSLYECQFTVVEFRVHETVPDRSQGIGLLRIS